MVAAHRVVCSQRKLWSRGFLLAAGGLTCLTWLAGLHPGAAAEEGKPAVRAEDVVPVVELLAAIRERFSEGRVLKLDLERERRPDGHLWVWVYEAKILMPDGDVFEVEYDALSLEVLEVSSPGDED